MRLAVAAAVLMLTACVSAQGAADQPAPFSAAAAQTPAAAQQTAATYPIAIDLPAGEYRNDPRHSSLFFRIRHEGLAWFTARMDKFTANLTLDPADPSHSTLEASVDTTSVNTNVLNAQGQRRFDQSIGRGIGGDANAPITFHSTSIQRTGEHTGIVTGDLTMNGQTHPATLDVTFDGGHTDPLRGHTAIGFSAHGQIDRTQWGVSYGNAFTGNEVQVVIEAEFVKA